MTSDTRDLDDAKQDLKYDHRNLLTEMRVVKKTGGGDGYETYQLMYNYDEAGNRVRKREYFYQGEDPMPVFEEDDMTGSWDLVGDEYYVRDVSGKEIAVYHSYDLDHWNVWGTDNVGKINANGDKFFYLKDHLGSVRVVLNSSNQIVSANDYDCWGYPLENRSYQSDDIDYKFTGKQRDAETGYDYFGARYYDARIANWSSVDPLLKKHIGWNPYNYVLRNPIALIDPDGKDPRRDQLGSKKDVLNVIKNSKDKSYYGLMKSFENDVKGHYLYTRNEGIIDMKHFFAAAYYASMFSQDATVTAGMLYEIGQKIEGERSNFAPEDANSNKLGAEYGTEINSNRENLDIKEFSKYLQSLDPIDPKSEEISEENVYIPKNQYSPELEKRSIYDFLNPKPFYGMDPKDHSKEIFFN